jgi:hypothetical protein
MNALSPGAQVAISALPQAKKIVSQEYGTYSCSRIKPSNYQRTLSSLYKLNFSSQVTTGIFSHTAWAMI